MSISPEAETKPMFTPEQRLALSRVYSFLMELGRQRLSRLNGKAADVPAGCHENDEAVQEVASTKQGSGYGK
jgi:hypothetical protein